MLNISHFTQRSKVLGPGIRAVIWVQGCCFNCPGCIAGNMHSTKPNILISPEEMAEKILGVPDIEGITISGGEPFLQARALWEMIEILKQKSDLSFFSYTGFTIEEILKNGAPDQIKFLSLLDILVDGRYMEDQSCDLIWRGSSNQKLYFLTDRYKHLSHLQTYRTRKLEFEVTSEGHILIIGIPDRDFLQELRVKLENKDILLSDSVVKRTCNE